MKKNDLNFFGIDEKNLEILRSMQENEPDNLEVQEAIKAINIASKVVNAIMSGNQIDPVFFKYLSDETQRRVNSLSGLKSEKKVLKKKKKFKKLTDNK